jgi:hypothetical protein
VNTRIGKQVASSNPDDELVGGQPRWFWRLNKAARRAELKRRAAEAGAEYVRDMSRLGLAPDGSAPEKAKLERAPKITKRDKKAVAKRLKKKGLDHDHN